MQGTQAQVAPSSEQERDHGHGGTRGADWVTLAVGILGAGAMLIGGCILGAWMSGVTAPWSAAGAVTMKANMALALVLAGAGLILLGLRGHIRWCRWTGLAVGAIVLLLGGLTLSEHVIGWDLGIDQLLAKEPPGAVATRSPNRMGVIGSIGHTLLGAAMLLLGLGGRGRGRRMVPYLGLAVILIILIPAVGYIYGVREFFRLSGTGIAWPTVLAMLGLGLGLVLACPDGPMVVLGRDDAGGRLLRRLLPVAVLLPLGLGFLRVLGQHHGFYDTAMGTGVLTLVLMVVFSAMLWHSARDVSRAAARQREAEWALRESEERLNQAVGVAGLGIFEHDHRSDVIYYSPTLRGIWGWSENEPVTVAGLVGRMPPEEREVTGARIRKAHDPGGEGLYATEHRIVRPDGGIRWLSVRSRTFFEGEGAARRAVRTVGAMLDITERREAEEELKAAKLIAEQARTVAEQASHAKDQFIAVLSHELRNPLNPVLATVAMLQKDGRFDADTREQLEVIHRNVELEARLIDDLLDVTRIERGKIELDRRPIELRTIIHRAAEVCLPDIEARKLEFGIDLGPAPYWVHADAARLQQVFWNLIKNAIKFTHVGGCVGVVCRPGDGQVVVEINDSGEGIDPEVLPRLFSAFEQGGRPVTRQFGGLGLGLTISKAMVELHGGSIEAYSAGKGKGATFTVRLPLVAGGGAEAAGAQLSAAPAARPAARPLRILLVEDHGDTARIMRRVLSAQGHEVHSAADVATAMKLADEQGFDLLLSDLGLPDGSGLDLMRALREQGLTLPAIALSGYGQEQDMRASREAGFAAHLTKPVDIQHLEDVIAEIVGTGP